MANVLCETDGSERVRQNTKIICRMNAYARKQRNGCGSRFRFPRVNRSKRTCESPRWVNIIIIIHTCVWYILTGLANKKLIAAYTETSESRRRSLPRTVDYRNVSLKYVLQRGLRNDGLHCSTLTGHDGRRRRQSYLCVPVIVPKMFESDVHRTICRNSIELVSNRVTDLNVTSNYVFVEILFDCVISMLLSRFINYKIDFDVSTCIVLPNYYFDTGLITN